MLGELTSESDDNLGELQFAPHAAWSRVGTASRMAAKMQVRRVRAELAKVSGELEAASKELARRRSTRDELEAKVEAAGATMLADGWAEVTDPESGGQYYYKAITGETTWERPEALPAGWDVVTDPDTGAVYFHHAATGATTWERPGAQEEPADDAPLVPMWKSLGLPVTASDRTNMISQIEAAAQAGDFEKAIELRNELRLSAGRSNSVHSMSASL